MKDPSTVNADTSLGDLGLDSLMGVEVKQTLERDFDTTLSMREIRQLTLSKLKGLSSSGSTGEVSIIKETREMEKNYVHRFNMECLVPKESCVLMKDVTNSNKILFLVHPVEGIVFSIKKLYAIKFRFLVRASHSRKSIESITCNYLRYMKKICHLYFFIS